MTYEEPYQIILTTKKREIVCFDLYSDFYQGTIRVTVYSSTFRRLHKACGAARFEKNQIAKLLKHYFVEQGETGGYRIRDTLGQSVS